MKPLDLLALSNASQSDLTKLIQRAIEPFGWYQILVVVILCLNNAVVAINHTITSFYIFTPENYQCADEKIALTNSTCTPGCSEYKFDDIYTSAVTEWSLVCDQRYISALLNTVYFSGVMVSSFVGGLLGDFIGRRKVILACLCLQGIFGVNLCMVKSLEGFILIRFTQGLFVQGLYYNALSLTQELTPPRYLTLTGLLNQAFWDFGMIFLGITSYFTPDWRILQLIITFPTILLLLLIWLVPESLTWNIENGYTLTAIQTALTIAKKNKDNLFIEECARFRPSPIGRSADENILKISPIQKIFYLFHNRILLKHTLVKILISFGGNFVYYLLILSAPNLASGRHVNFIIGALMELCIASVGLLALSGKFGRRNFLIIAHYTVVLAAITHSILIFASEKDPSLAWMTNFAAIFSKGLVCLVTSTLVIYKVELFPTILRATAMGLIGVSGKVGALMAPQIKLLGEISHPVVPTVITATLMFANGTATFALPETLNKKLPNSIEDVEEAWGKKEKVTRD